MSNIVRFPDIDTVEQEACEWMARLDAGELSPAETGALQQWLNTDERHREMLIEVATLMDQMSVVSMLNRLLPLSEVSMEDQPRGRGSRQWVRSFGLGIAASLMLFGILLGYFEATHEPEYQTAVGEIRDVVLADGSRLTLNTNSMISVRFNDRERRIFLERGEALFKVSHDKQRPFIVEANGFDIRAVGTAFNVSHTARDFEITVTEGIVEVVRKSASVTPAFSKRSGPAVESAGSRLAAGEQITISENRVITQSVNQAEVDALLSWRQRELVFHGQSLEYVVAEVSRYSPVRIVVADESLRNIPVGGVFATGDIDDLVDLLEHGFGIQASKSSDGSINLTRTTSSN